MPRFVLAHKYLFVKWLAGITDVALRRYSWLSIAVRNFDHRFPLKLWDLDEVRKIVTLVSYKLWNCFLGLCTSSELQNNKIVIIRKLDSAGVCRHWTARTCEVIVKGLKYFKDNRRCQFFPELVVEVWNVAVRSFTSSPLRVFSNALLGGFFRQSFGQQCMQ